jgi:hypothetical protein
MQVELLQTAFTSLADAVLEELGELRPGCKQLPDALFGPMVSVGQEPAATYSWAGTGAT